VVAGRRFVALLAYRASMAYRRSMKRTVLLSAIAAAAMAAGLAIAQVQPVPTSPAKPPPAIERDAATLPPRVAAMRDAIIEAALSGDVEKLRLVSQRNELPPLFVKGQKGDAIAGLTARSGDGQGRETLAILLNLLDAGFVRANPGTPKEMYIWPWFAEYPPKTLGASQLVEVYRVLPARDFKESLDRDRYLFYRVGIGPDGTWHYFLAGE
jgi:hypothetical protein